MRYLSVDVVANHAYLIPIGDIHIGDKAFGKIGRAKLAGYIDWVKKTPNARVFLMGDIFNVASRNSKTSPFETNASEYDEAEHIFKPIARQIIGVISGNHEARMEDMFGYNPLQGLCSRLEVPYCGWSAVIELHVGRLKDTHGRAGTKHNTYFVYCHHTTGGGGTLGGALNRSVKLQDLVQGIDVYCGGHNHNLATGVRSVMVPYPPGHRMREHKITYVDCGSYLDWDGSYAEKGMLPPGKLGSPRIRFAGYKHTHHGGALRDDSRDVHVSL